MRRFFCGLGRRSHDDGEFYVVQSMPETQQPSRRPEDYRVTQSRIQTSVTETNELRIELVPYDHSPKGSPGTRQSMSHTGYRTPVHNDRFGDKRNKSSHTETNRSAVEKMRQSYKDQIHNLQVKIQNMKDDYNTELQQCHNSLRQYKNKQEESERRKRFLEERQVEQEKEITRQKEAKIQLQNDNKLLQNQVINEQSELQDTKIRLQQYQTDLKSALEQKQEETNIKTQLQTALKQQNEVNDKLQKDKERLNANITKLESANQQLSRQMEQNRFQAEQLQKEGAKRNIDDITTLQNKLSHSEQALKDTKTQLQETELRFEQLQQEKQSLEARNAEHDIIQTENDRMKKEINDLQEALDREQKSKHKLSDDYNAIQQRFREVNHEFNKTKTRLQQCQDEIRSLQEENTQIQKSLDSQWSKESDTLKTDNDKLHAEKDRLNAENNRLQNQVAELRHEHSQLQGDNEKLKKQMNDYSSLQNKLDIKEQEFNTAKLELKETKDRLRDTLQSNITDDSKLSNLQQANLELKSRMTQVQHRNDQLEREMENLKRRLNDVDIMQHKLHRVEGELKSAEAELEDTKTRLSKCMGDQLTNNNPNIVDLSDMNRPSKLADRYKELYDNQWTDAYEILEESVETEEQIINILLNILIETKRFCDNQTESEMDHILRAITRKDRWQQSDVPVGVIKYIKDCRKSTVAATMKTKYKDYVDDIKRSQTSFVKHALRIDAYLLECFEVCWLMAIQDPPVVLAPVLKHGDNFKADLYSAYTVTGKIVDYVVWPALLLHTNGPTLTKGVAQGMKKR